MGAKIRYLWCEAICAYLHSDLTNMERTFSMEQYEIDVRDSEIIDEYIKFDSRIVQERQVFLNVSFFIFYNQPLRSISSAVSW